jgi:hypothetical protein
MSVAALRALVLDVNVTAHGMPVTVTVPGGVAVPASGIWMTPETEDVNGQPVQRREARQVLMLRRSDFSTVPKASVVVGCPPNATSRRWLVDATDRVEVDRVYVVVVPAPED